MDDLHSKKVFIVGIGGVGSLVAEMLVRCGVKTLAILDLDTVERVNLNRLFFTEEHIGKSKVEVAKEQLLRINPDVEIKAYHTDLCSEEFEKQLEEILEEYDLTISCLDNLLARLYLNEKCVHHNHAYVDTGATRSGLGGYVHLVIPFKTACYACMGSIDLTTRKRGKNCTASLPSTIAIIASLATEIALKYLLNFGTIPDHISFNALTDQFVTSKMQRDPNCYVCGNRDVPQQKERESLNRIKRWTQNKSLTELITNLESREKEG